jgi:RNA polymerase sigma-70 factor (ECF subfamily)
MRQCSAHNVEIFHQTALEEAWRAYGKDLCRYSFQKVGDAKQSEDIVQDTFMRTWAYMQKNGKIDCMKSFLYRTLRNRIVDEYRKRKSISLDRMLEAGFEPSGEDWRERHFDAMDGKAIFLLTERLPEKYRKVLLLKYREDMSLEEISRITGNTKNSVSVHLSRGMRRLRILATNSDIFHDVC